METRKEDNSLFDSLLGQEEITKTEIAPRLVRYNSKAAKQLASTCKGFHTFFQHELDKLALEQLQLAVIDDDRKKVKRILDTTLRAGILA